MTWALRCQCIRCPAAQVGQKSYGEVDVEAHAFYICLFCPCNPEVVDNGAKSDTGARAEDDAPIQRMMQGTTQGTM